MGGTSTKLPATVEMTLSIIQLRTIVPATEEEMETAALVGKPTVVVHKATAKAEKVEAAEKEEKAAKAVNLPQAPVPAANPAVCTPTKAANIVHPRQQMHPLGLLTG